ncbi:MAG: DUF3343 domain-containing protein [Clostridia bacterium]|nr:DUF3343 domain-containing protein [Clostridia bacterium]
MGRYYISTGSITYAIKGRDTLRNKGFKVWIERNSKVLSSGGCGYNIVLDGDINSAERELKKAGVKILQINEG